VKYVKIREKISAAYWGLVDRVGPLVPTPQVIGAALTGVVLGLLNKYAIDLSVVSISPAVVAGAIALGVAYLIGPEKIKGEYFDPKYDAVITPPKLQAVGSTDRKPEIVGEYVGPEDDPNAPGSGLV